MRVERTAPGATAAAPHRGAATPGFESALVEAQAPVADGGPAGVEPGTGTGLAAGMDADPALGGLLLAQAASGLASIGTTSHTLGGLDEDEVLDRQARRHGKAMLEALAGLQMAVLGGDAGSGRARLVELSKAPPEAADPVLRLILREINIRAAVELARPEGIGGTSRAA